MDRPWSQKNTSGSLEPRSLLKSEDGPRQGAWRPISSGRSFTSSALSQKPELDLELRHGVVPGARIFSDRVLRRVLLLPERNCLVALDTRGVQIWDARRIPRREVEIEVDDLVYAPKANRFVAYKKNQIKLLNDNFELIYEADTPRDISCAVYNSLTNEIVTCGTGNVTLWNFRRGAKILSPRQEIKDDVSSTDTLSTIHLEKVASRTQRGFISNKSSILIFNLHDGRHLRTLKDLHPRPITCFLYHPHLGYLITAAKDGSVKVWNENFSLLHVFVSHKRSVTCMALHPNGSQLLTGSADTTIRSWNLEMGKEVERLETLHPVEGLVGCPRHNEFYSFSTTCINTWTINHLHDLLIQLGSSVTKLTSTSHPRVPLRLLAVCANSTVHIISPVSGDVISTALLPVKETIKDVAYTPELEELYVLCNTGIITEFNTKYHPAVQVKSFNVVENYSCLAIYEYTLDEEMLQELVEHDKWFGVALSVLGRDMQTNRDRTLLFAGQQDGQIVLVNRKTGAIDFTVQAHHGAVTSVVGNPKRDLLISAGTDSIIKVWKLFPFVQDVISPLLSFYCAYPITHVLMAADQLLSVFQNPATVTYTLAAFSLSNKNRHDHDPDTDHDDTIVGLACCQKIRVFATCSLDGTVRVWNDKGNLLRIIYLNAVPEGISFSDSRGNLTVAIGGQLHTISYKKYLSKPYLEQLITLHLPSAVAEYCHKPAAEISLDDNERLRLIPQQNTTHHRYSPVSEAPSLLESEQYKQEQLIKEQMIALLAARNVEIDQIRDGLYEHAKKRNKSGQQWKNMVWKSYWKDFGLRKTSVQVPEEDDFNADTYGREIIPRIKSEEPFQHLPSLNKFFPPPGNYIPPYRVAPDGHLPNSVLLRDFLKGQSLSEVREIWKPKALSASQLAELMARKQLEQPEEEDEGFVVDWEDDKYDETDFMAKLRAALVEPEEEEEDREPTPEPEPELKSPPKKIEPAKKIVKLVAPKKPKTPTPPPPKEPSPVPPTEPPRSPTPPPPPPATPLPDFITQFMSEPWFNQFFPDSSLINFPKPWTVSHFVDLLVPCIRRASMPEMKASICNAIHLLHQQEGLTKKGSLIETLLSELNSSVPPNPYLDNEKEFILEALSLLFALGAFTSGFVIELMVQYMDGDEEMRKIVTAYFMSMGLDDPHLYFIPKELDSFETWGFEEENRKGQLSKVAADWLEHWTARYQRYLLSPSGGETGAGRQSRQSSSLGGRLSRGTAKKKSKHTLEQVQCADDVVEDPLSKPIDIINYFVQTAHIEEMARLRALRPRHPTEESTEGEPKKNTVLTLPRIHKTSLARLGETHRSKCHPERETSLALCSNVQPAASALQDTGTAQLPVLELQTYNMSFRSLLHGFSRCLSLALCPNIIMPFIEEEEELLRDRSKVTRISDSQMPSLASSTKYFIPERSHVQDL